MLKCATCQDFFLTHDEKVLSAGVVHHYRCINMKSDSTVEKVVEATDSNSGTHVGAREELPNHTTHTCMLCKGNKKSVRYSADLKIPICDLCLQRGTSAENIIFNGGSNTEKEDVPKCECEVCGNKLTPETRFCYELDDCLSCNECAVNWIATKISDGDSTRLICPCTKKHPLLYKHVAKIIEDLPSVTRSTYEASLRNATTSMLKEINRQCPECENINSVPFRATTYRCFWPNCGIREYDICVEHNVHHQREGAFFSW